MPLDPDVHAPDVPGVELAGVIGRGGSGVVYLGRQVAFDRDVAVKVTSGGGAPEESVHRWEREVAAVGRLSNHPNIVPVFDAGITEDGSPYLVMPYAPGGTLGDRIRDEGSMRPAEVASIGAKLAGALASVHTAGVLHRDVKPDNVLWSPHGEPQLTDFGIARLQDLTTTLHGGLHATVAYAAPELMRGEAASESSDVYSLGATLYACLTGGAPHRNDSGDNVLAFVAKVRDETPPPLSSAGVPEPLAGIVGRAMSRDPAARHPSAEALRSDLDGAAALLAAGGGEHVPAPGTHPATVPVVVPRPRDEATIVRPAVRGSSGNRGLWATVVAVLVLFGALLAFGLTRDDESDRDTAATDDPAVETSTTEAVTTEPPTTAEPTTTTEATTTTQTPAEPTAAAEDGEGNGSEVSDAAVTYIRTLDRGDLDEAWQLTTPRFQNAQDREQWEGFWGGFDRIEIVGDLRTDTGSGTVVIPLSLDGQREDYRLELARQGGDWLVDGPVGS